MAKNSAKEAEVVDSVEDVEDESEENEIEEPELDDSLEDSDVGETLYSRLVGSIGVSFDPDNYSPSEYKTHLCQLASDRFADDAAFDALHSHVQTWLNVATATIKENRKAQFEKDKKLLPPIQGFPAEDEAVHTWAVNLDAPDEAAAYTPKKRGRGRAAASGAPKPPKEKKEKVRNPKNNRYAKVGRIMINNPTMTDEEVHIAAEKSGDTVSDATLGYCIAAFRAAYTVFTESGWKPPAK